MDKNIIELAYLDANNHIQIEKKYIKYAYKDTSELDHKDLMLLMAVLYKRLDALDALE